jgi:hypothetical protein
MRRLLAATIISAVTVVLMPTTGSADPYKWCAVYGSDMGGASNCGFVTIEQCRATVSGMGGFCEPNQFYTGPAEKPAQHARKRSRD